MFWWSSDFKLDDCPAMYLDEIDTFKDWCDSHHLIFNIKNDEADDIWPQTRESPWPKTKLWSRLALLKIWAYSWTVIWNGVPM